MSAKRMSLKDLKNAGWNPASRIANVVPLMNSIERVGLMYPILITEDNKIIDGHRRLAAAKELGWTDIPVLVAKGSQAEMFCEVNGATKPLNGNQTMQVYLAEPLAVGPKARASIEELEECVGRRIVERMAKEGFSLGTWYSAKSIARAADNDDTAMITEILKWLLKFRCSHTVRRALQHGTSPSKIIAAVKRSKPIRVTYAEG